MTYVFGLLRINRIVQVVRGSDTARKSNIDPRTMIRTLRKCQRLALMAQWALKIR